jgi:uncharacterized membrane protein YbaN (DUF454 family)
MLKFLRNHLFVFVGWIFVGLGVIGAVLPIVPTVPFLLLAAYLFSKGSPKLYAWLVSIPKFGPEIKNWNEFGVISKRSKLLSVSALVMVIIYFWILLKTFTGFKVVATLTIISVAAFILNRPSENQGLRSEEDDPKA